MGAIGHQIVRTEHGTLPLLRWLSEHACRNCADFTESEQLTYALLSAREEDKQKRSSMLKLLHIAAGLQKRLEECHIEFDTISRVLLKLEEAEKKEKEDVPKE